MSVLRLNKASAVLCSPLNLLFTFQAIAPSRPRVAVFPATTKQTSTVNSKPEPSCRQQQREPAYQQHLSAHIAGVSHPHPHSQPIYAMQDPSTSVTASDNLVQQVHPADDATPLAAPATRHPEQQTMSEGQYSLSVATAEGTEHQETQGMQPEVLGPHDGHSGLVSQDQHSSKQQQHHEQRQQGKQHQQQKPRPTHFVSLRVSHYPQVVSCIEHVQQQLVAAAPELQPCLLEPVTAHMTVMVLLIQSQEQESIAATVMASLPNALQQQGLGQLPVTLQGLSTFRNQVLYLDVAPGQASEQLQRLGDAVISHFRAHGSEIVVEEPGRGFTPHVTVAKTSRLLGGVHRPKRGRSHTKIPKEAWSDLDGVSAGDVLLTELQICSMQGRKANEYYKVTHNIQLPEMHAPPAAAATAAAATEAPAAAATAAAPAAITAEPPAATAAPGSPLAQADNKVGSPPATAAVTGTATAPGNSLAQPEPAAVSSLAGAKRRFKQLLGALVCRRKARLPTVARVDDGMQQHGGSTSM